MNIIELLKTYPLTSKGRRRKRAVKLFMVHVEEELSRPRFKPDIVEIESHNMYMKLLKRFGDYDKIELILKKSFLSIEPDLRQKDMREKFATQLFYDFYFELVNGMSPTKASMQGFKRWFEEQKKAAGLVPVPKEEVLLDDRRPVEITEQHTFEEIGFDDFDSCEFQAKQLYLFAKKHSVLKKYPNLHMLEKADHKLNLEVQYYAFQMKMWSLTQGIRLGG